MVKAINIEGEAKCEGILNILPSINNIPINNEQINIQQNYVQQNNTQQSYSQQNNIQQNYNQQNNIQPNYIQPNNIQQSYIQPNSIQQNIIQPNSLSPEFIQLFTDQQTSVNSTIKFEARLIGTQPLNVKNQIFFSFDFDFFNSFRSIGCLMVHQY